jgi:hypothetical protein
MLLTILEHKQHDVKTSSVKRKDQAFWASCTPPRQSEMSSLF